jgi:RNA-binding protein
MALSGKANRYLRSLGHSLDPVVQIGKEGVSDGLVAATARALLDHELIKVRVLGEAPDDRHDSLAALAKRTGSELVQVIGRTGLLYRRHPEKPRIQLPRAGARPAPKPAPRTHGAPRAARAPAPVDSVEFGDHEGGALDDDEDGFPEDDGSLEDDVDGGLGADLDEDHNLDENEGA